MFERAMLESTPCEIHTFDCTFNGEPLPGSAGRHFFHRWCIGTPAAGQQYRSWANITAALGHDRQQLDIVKVDIEGHEAALLAQLGSPGAMPPRELVLEVHVRISGRDAHSLASSDGFRHWLDRWLAAMAAGSPQTAGELALLMLHLAGLGYGTVALEVSEGVPACCAEVSLLHVGGGSSSSSSSGVNVATEGDEAEAAAASPWAAVAPGEVAAWEPLRTVPLPLQQQQQQAP